MPLLPATRQHVSPLARHAANPVGIIRQSALCRLCRERHKRHTFAVHRLLRWYRDGVDVQARLPLLSTFMGHVEMRSTEVYLTVTQELLQEANKRYHQHFGRLLDEEGGQ